MPVSEATNVTTKFLFGTLGFVLASIAAAWVMYTLLSILGWGSIETDSEGNVQKIEASFQPIKLFIWPLHGVLAGIIWGAPVFAYCMFISAYAKRARFLWLIVPLLCVSVLEGIFLRSRNSVDFFFSHMPHVALDTLQSAESTAAFWTHLFGPMLPSTLLGLVMAAAFIAGAIWCRNNRFEV